MQKNLALTWQLTEVHGWGLVGVHTALYLMDQGRPPVLLEKPAMSSLRPQNRARLAGLEESWRQTSAMAEQHPGQMLLVKNAVVLHALGNGFLPGPPSARFRGEGNVGVIAFEDTWMTPEVVARARSHDKMIVHSTYNMNLLLEQGVENVVATFQGVDPSEMGPLPPAGRFGDRFVIFSGGKMEFRKAQDVVLAAFIRFHARHPDAVLATAWHNVWPHTAASIAESPLGVTAPIIGADGRLDIRGWAAANGAPMDAFIDLGFLGRDQIAPVLADCHAAVFPNRCEGATNLVAMEAMACGAPTILSANTGHHDIIRDGVCLPLTRQTPSANRSGHRNGWMESSVDELVEHLETLYADRERARAMGARASAFILGERTWRAFAESFVDAALS